MAMLLKHLFTTLKPVMLLGGITEIVDQAANAPANYTEKLLHNAYHGVVGGIKAPMTLAQAIYNWWTPSD